MPDLTPQQIADRRELDRVLRPINDRILARLGLTREEVLSWPLPAESAVGLCREEHAQPSPPPPRKDSGT